MDFILTGLDAISNFFGIIAAIGEFVTGFWSFGVAIADFLTWLIEFVQGIAELFG